MEVSTTPLITLELTILSSCTLIMPAVAFCCTVPRSELSMEIFLQSCGGESLI